MGRRDGGLTACADGVGDPLDVGLPFSILQSVGIVEVCEGRRGSVVKLRKALAVGLGTRTVSLGADGVHPEISRPGVELDDNRLRRSSDTKLDSVGGASQLVLHVDTVLPLSRPGTTAPVVGFDGVFHVTLPDNTVISNDESRERGKAGDQKSGQHGAGLTSDRGLSSEMQDKRMAE